MDSLTQDIMEILIHPVDERLVDALRSWGGSSHR